MVAFAPQLLIKRPAPSPVDARCRLHGCAESVADGARRRNGILAGHVPGEVPADQLSLFLRRQKRKAATAPYLPVGVGALQLHAHRWGGVIDGDVAHGQFLTQIAGKDVWVTLSGHLGSKDGYATFDPTEFKVGDLNVPVSLVNDALQKKLNEQRDRLKLPENVGGMKVENGELVMTQK